MADIKNFLYAWCGKKKLTPSYDIRRAGNKNRQKFLCEVRIEGLGMGNSTNKKDAQANAARDLVNYLVRDGEMNAAEVQALGVSVPDFSGGAGANAPSGPVPGVTGLGYSGGDGGGNYSGGAGNSNAPWDRGANLKDYYSKRDEQEAQATLESEEVDLNAGLHGNWILENAKARMNQFFQKEKNQKPLGLCRGGDLCGLYSALSQDGKLVVEDFPLVVWGLCFGKVGGVISFLFGPVWGYHRMGPQCLLTPPGQRDGLPVKNFEREIISAVQGNSVVIIRGATGCGKTTQVPQYILDLFIKSGRASDCNIIVTQPRRISAVSVAERVSYKRGEDVGVLLRKLETGIRGINHVIVGEIHERDLNVRIADDPQNQNP
ncbi:ATP-dependent RNA helicase A protein-like [Salvelinus fontinalis]|uniref:ATP-dependent RNA helicase A protein-like n=1 Tax=Salvelinus fontinalis TaxID=8038 RepID=UPI0024863EA3|nr:ATP-dependent RNA helicase A protein-like [Salvelinus fontinalis]